MTGASCFSDGRNSQKSIIHRASVGPIRSKQQNCFRFLAFNLTAAQYINERLTPMRRKTQHPSVFLSILAV